MSTPLETVLAEALDDEFKARATYRAVIDAFGPARPFSNIVSAEGRHIHALLGLYDRFGIAPPADAWHDRVPAPASLEDACREGVAAEKENGAMYDRLLRATKDPEVRRVLLNLQRASQENHLPAFERGLRRVRGRAAANGPGNLRRRLRRHRGGRRCRAAPPTGA